MRSYLRPLALALLPLWLGCSTLGALNPFGNSTDPAGAFGSAKAGYVAAFRSAATYVQLCQAQVPTESCDRFTVKLYDDVNPRAREIIAVGEGLMAGISTQTCDEVVEPGCTARLRDEQLANLATMLQQLAITLNARK